MSDFHGRIMNLQPDYAKPDAHAVVYKRGFRDARHVAAEIGLEADALLVRLNEAQSDAGAWEATAQHHYEEARVAEARLAEAERVMEKMVAYESVEAKRLAETEAALLDKIAEQGARLTEAERIIRATECQCNYIGDGEVIECRRCEWLTVSASGGAK